jgi:Uncharacterised nucleotidyltransferase
VPEALGNRPDSEQLLLLHAALDEPSAAAAAWQRWTETVDLNRVDPATLRLLPLAYTRLPELHQILGPAGREFDAVRGGLREMYRGSWQRNQILFSRAGEAIASLSRAGIETMVLKGASLAVLAYGDGGARPMDDVDLLVPAARREEAFELLASAGWRAARPEPREWAQVHHSLGYSRNDGGEIDLHWFSLWQPADEAELWRSSVPFELAGLTTRAPCAPDQLLLACVHGTPWSRLPAFRWIADAMVLIRAEGSFNWDRVAAEAERRQLTVPTGAALAYLREEFAAPVPEALLTRLDAAPASHHERAAFRAAGRPDSPGRTLRMAWDRYRRLRDLDTGMSPPSSFVDFARRFWGLDSAWQLPLHAARSLRRRRPNR